MIAQFIERRRWKMFRRLVRLFLNDFAFDRMIAVIAEEQQERYYEDNYYTRLAQFHDAVGGAVKVVTIPRTTQALAAQASE